MPSLTVPMNPVADTTFKAQGKRLSIKWNQPTGEAGTQYKQAFTEQEKVGTPDPTCYFMHVSINKYHVDQCKEIGDQFKSFCHSMLKGFKQAMDTWRVQAYFQNLRINGPTATGSPGCLKGPSLKSFIQGSSLPSAKGNEAHWRDAVATGLADCFKKWQDGLTVPGLPFYPAFAAFPGPMAPPMPNVPFPLVACPSSGLAQMQPSALKSAMTSNFSLDDPDDQFGAMAISIGTAVSSAFMAWLPTQQIMNCMGQGPVPSFAPPAVPAGPVVQGSNLPTPGHLAT